VQLYDGGDQVAGQVSLDLCAAHFPSEALRTSRWQVGVADPKGNETMSTEALVYRDVNATTQAFSELRAARANCPTGFVTSAVDGEPPLKTVFNASPDASWPATPGVDRLAYDTTVSDQHGHTDRSTSVYLRHGRALLAIYFDGTATQPSISGRTSTQAITQLLSSRLAKFGDSASI
jgi:hypothetical protein